MARETLLILDSNPLRHDFKPLKALLRVDIRLVIRSHDLILVHIEDGQVQAKNRWPCESSPWEHKTQVVLGSKKDSLSLVLSLPIIASHNTKLCLGNDRCSQTSLFQQTIVLLNLKCSYAVVEYRPDEVSQLCSEERTWGCPLHSCSSSLLRERIDFHNGEEVFWTVASHMEVWWR
jgi:hypothetical protein